MVIRNKVVVSLHKTILDGFNAEFMRWRERGKVMSGSPSGFLLRGFGFRFMLYRLAPWGE